jgi:hypothetical protein
MGILYLAVTFTGARNQFNSSTSTKRNLSVTEKVWFLAGQLQANLKLFTKLIRNKH